MKCSNTDVFFSFGEIVFYLEPFKNKTFSLRNTNYTFLSSLNDVFMCSYWLCVFIFFKFQTLQIFPMSPSFLCLSSSIIEILNSCFTSSVLFFVFLLKLLHFESCNQNKTVIAWLLPLRLKSCEVFEVNCFYSYQNML